MSDLMGILNAIGDSAIEVVKTVPKIAMGTAGAAEKYAAQVDARLTEIQRGMPAHPEVLLKAPLGALADTIGFVSDVITPIGSALGSTARGISYEINKIRV